MANDWTRLLVEAKKHGGPGGLKAAYMVAGAVSFIAIQHLGKGLGWGMAKVHVHYAKKKADGAANASVPETIPGLNEDEDIGHGKTV